MLASLLALLALLLVALLYVKCRLNVLLWYQDKYGEVEVNGAWGPDVGEGGLPRLSLQVGVRRHPSLEGSGRGVSLCSPGGRGAGRRGSRYPGSRPPPGILC